MTFFEGAALGVAGSALYQLVAVYDYRLQVKKWPWQDKKSGRTLPFFVFTVVVKFVAAFSVVGLMVSTQQISGPWAAAGAGMVADLIVIKTANGLRKEYAE